MWLMEWLSLEQRRVRGDIINAYKYLKGREQEDGARLCSVMPSSRKRDNSHKMKESKFHLNMRKISLLCGWQSTGTCFPGKFLSTLLWRYSKPYLDIYPVQSVEPASSEGLNYMISKGLLQPQQSVKQLRFLACILMTNMYSGASVL